MKTVFSRALAVGFLELLIAPTSSLGAATPNPPKLRLGDTAVPTRCALEMTLLPEEDSYTGKIQIDLKVRRTTSLLWLNATQLSIAEATMISDREKMSARIVPGGEDFVGFAFPRPARAGQAKLEIQFKGTLSKTEAAGLFKQQEAGAWYVFSQFEAIYARQAFPCFDEPSFKVPWQVTLRVKKGLMAVSNTRVISETVGADGMKTVLFAETKPLPSYLVAVGVGPFQVVEAGNAGSKSTSIRIIVPKNWATEADYAARSISPLFTRLENYFGIPYPYDKLDYLVIPHTTGWGAMENPGLITFVAEALLAKPEDFSLQFQRNFAAGAAHEMAHQWFGDLVTLAWWDDLWLNEAFASWMEEKIVEQWKPEWGRKVEAMQSRSRAMSFDSMIAARKIRQPIESNHDIANAFDPITYLKGAAVLAMFENSVGPERFQRGVQRYLKNHAFGNATASDFLRALSAEAHAPIGPPFSTFLDQPGVPLVSIKLQCSTGTPPRLLLSQKRFLPLGSKGSSDQVWQIPICVRFGANDRAERACFLLKERTATLSLQPKESFRTTLKEGKSNSRRVADCPEWLFGNEAGAGYYRAAYGRELLQNLISRGYDRLSVAERLNLVGDLNASVASGSLPISEALVLVPRLAQEANRHIVTSAIDLVPRVESGLVPDDLRPNFARFVQANFRERARQLGWKSQAGDDEDTKLLRASLVSFVAKEGQDRELIEEALRLAQTWLKDRRAVEPELTDSVLRIAALNGGRALFDQFYAEARQTKDQHDRERVLRAMGSFGDPEISQVALSILLTDEFDIREAIGIIFDRVDLRAALIRYEFLKKNFDALTAKLPKDIAAYLSYFAQYQPHAGYRADVEAFFKDRMDKFPGGPRNLALALERIDLNHAFNEAHLTSLVEFLKKI